MQRPASLRWGAFLLSVVGVAAGLFDIALSSRGLAANSDSVHAEHEGVWRSHGYGWLWSVENGRLTTYDEIGDLCTKNSRQGELDPRAADATIKISADGQSLTVKRLHDNYIYTFDRVDAVPRSCRSKAPADPKEVVEAAIAILGKHYPFFSARSIDWAGVAEAARRQVSANTTERALFEILRQLLSHFPDSHVGLEASVDDKELSYDPSDEPSYDRRSRPKPDATIDPSLVWNSDVVEKWLTTSKRTMADEQVTFGRIDDIGYLKIDGMEGYSIAAADRALKKAVACFSNAKAVIVDVSSNGGGHDSIATRIAGHFAPRRTIGYYKYPGDSHDPPQPIFVEPSKDGVYSGPVYLLTSWDSISAAEVFVLAMRALPNVTHVGETTDGSFSDRLWKQLPNGWRLTLSNEVYLDSQGIAWEGRGIIPKFEIKVENDEKLSPVHVRALRRLLDKLQFQPEAIGVQFSQH